MFRGVIGVQAQAAASLGARDLWHHRLGHPSNRILSFLSSHVDVGKPVETEVICDTCFRAKQILIVITKVLIKLLSYLL